MLSKRSKKVIGRIKMNEGIRSEEYSYHLYKLLYSSLETLLMSHNENNTEEEKKELEHEYFEKVQQLVLALTGKKFLIRELKKWFKETENINIKHE